jgi:hypothetical protein
MRAIMFGVVLALSALFAGSVAASKCDTGVDKASAKQVSCMCKALPKGFTRSAIRLRAEVLRGVFQGEEGE